MKDEDPAPAYSRDSQVLQLSGRVSLDHLSPEWAWGGATGAGVRVAVVDSGIDAGHPALGDCIDVDKCVELRDVDGTVEEIHGSHGDAYGHGTACAGIIHMLAPQASITSVRVLGAGLTGKAAVFLRGLAWAVEQGFDVINLSLGTTRREWALPFYEVCDEAYFRNSFVVTAANNIMRPSFPCMFGAVTSVACNLSDDPLRFHYNPQPPTEFLARGIDVEIPWLDHGWISGTGNSYAAPHIAGFAALIRSKHPQLRPFQVKTVLWATAANVQDAPEIAGRLSRVLRPATHSSARATSALRRSGR
ncbi:MAG TPA: S8 family serine peptidase [Acidimicrobiia bacterium]|nr:S8 family serine peptidase [Acidimicrobiia bacterium]